MAWQFLLSFVVLFVFSFLEYQGGAQSGRITARIFMSFAFSTVLFWIWGF